MIPKLRLKALCLLFLCIPPLLAVAEDTEAPRVVLVLAGGGALGFAHVGVIKVLEEEGIRPDMVIGVSMGSLVGGLYSTGYPPEAIENIVNKVDWKVTMEDSFDRRLMDFDDKKNEGQLRISTDLERGISLGTRGFSSAQHVVEMLDSLLAPYSWEIHFDTLPIPFRAVATDLLTGEKVVLDHGDLKLALRASMAVPGAFTPVMYEGRHLIDGGWSENLPVSVAQDMGADIIIGVSLFSLEEDIDQLNSINRIFYQAEQIRSLAPDEETREVVDLFIAPNLSGYSMTDFEKGPALMNLGYQQADSQRAEIQALADRLGTAPTTWSREGGGGSKSVTIKEIHFTTWVSPEDRVILQSQFQDVVGQESSLEELRQRLYQNYDKGRFSHFWYSLIPQGEDLYTLRIDAPRIERPVSSLGLSLDFSSQFIESRISRGYLQGSYQQWLDPEKDLLFYTDLELSDFPSMTVGVKSTIPGGALKVGIQGLLSSKGHYFFDGDSVNSQYSLRQGGVRLYGETPIFKSLLLRGSLFTDYNMIDHKLGPDLLNYSPWGRLGVEGLIILDSLDRNPLPRSGSTAFYQIQALVDHLGAYQVIFGTGGQIHLSLPYHWEVIPRWEGTGLILGDPRAVEIPSLGEWLNIYGYYPQELKGDNTFMAGMDIQKKAASLPLGLGNEVYLFTGVNYAAIWQQDLLQEDKMLSGFWGVGGGVRFNTTIGAIEVHFSRNQENRLATFIGLKTNQSFGGRFLN